jgi:hypothetical protein
MGKCPQSRAAAQRSAAHPYVRIPHPWVGTGKLRALKETMLGVAPATAQKQRAENR